MSELIDLHTLKCKINGEPYKNAVYNCLGTECLSQRVTLEEVVKCCKSHGIENLRVYNLLGKEIDHIGHIKELIKKRNITKACREKEKSIKMENRIYFEAF